MCDWDTGAISISRISDMAEAFEPWEGTESDYTDAVVEAFGRSVERSLAGDHPFGGTAPQNKADFACRPCIADRGEAGHHGLSGVMGGAEGQIGHGQVH